MKKYTQTFEEFNEGVIGFNMYSTGDKKKLSDLLKVKAKIKISGKNEIEVKVSGNELGYDDDQWYSITWDPKNKSVESGTYTDKKLKDFVTATNWSKEAKTIEEFADIINGESKGEWE